MTSKRLEQYRELTEPVPYRGPHDETVRTVRKNKAILDLLARLEIAEGVLKTYDELYSCRFVTHEGASGDFMGDSVVMNTYDLGQNAREARLKINSEEPL